MGSVAPLVQAAQPVLVLMPEQMVRRVLTAKVSQDWPEQRDFGTGGGGGAITIENFGSIDTAGQGIHAEAIGPAGTNPISITNSGSVLGGPTGIFASGPTSISIVNSGFVSDRELFAIDTVGASTTIDNSGTVLGFIDLTDSNDTFTNRSGGFFEARSSPVISAVAMTCSSIRQVVRCTPLAMREPTRRRHLSG